MSVPRNIQLGLCCLNTILREQKPPVFPSRNMIIRSIEKQGIEVLKEKIRQNLKDVLTMIYFEFRRCRFYCDIRSFRKSI